MKHKASDKTHKFKLSKIKMLQRESVKISDAGASTLLNQPQASITNYESLAVNKSTHDKNQYASLDELEGQGEVD